MQNKILKPSFFLFFLLFSATSAFAGMESRVDADTLRALSRPVKAGARLRLERVPIGDETATLDLERFEVWAPNAEIVVDHGDGTREHIQPPPMQYFRGSVAGDPDSMVFLSVRSDGATDGLIIANERRYAMRSRAANDVFTEEVGFTDDIPGAGGFTCDLDQAPILSLKGGVPTVRTDSLRDVATEGTLSGTGSWTLNLAVETDNELYVDMGSNAGTLTTFVTNVVGAASTIYKRDLSTDLVIAYLRVQTSAADPWNVVPGAAGTWNGNPVTYSTLHALEELGDVWHNTPPSTVRHSSVVFLSGKNQTAGVAWVGTSCTGDFPYDGSHFGGAYAYMGLGNPSTSVPDPNATNNGIQYGLGSNYWPVLALAHELGHNVNGPHTHCMALTAQDKSTYNVTRNYIDECYAGQGGCFAGATSVPAEKGTVMSYCHLLGSSNSRYLFGKAGEVSELMSNRIKNYINSMTPNSPAINAPASVGPGGSGNASINGPVAGYIYDWTITNGTINGATQGTSISFTASANPVTIRARATNTSGCAASDSVNVTMNTCQAPAITSITPSTTITAGFSIDLSATATGTAPITYQWYIGTPGNTSNPAPAGNPVSVAPGVNTTYWVRATNSCGTADSGAVNIGVVTPPSTGTSLYILTPCRVIDTRGPVGPYGGPALANATNRDVQITGACGIPVTAKAVVANLTAVAPSTGGFLALFPGGTTWPGNSTLNYRANKTRANNAILILSNDGRVTVRNVGATQHFIIDVTGYYE